MKQKNKLIVISTGLAATILAISLSTVVKSDKKYTPRLDIMQDNSLENYIDDYQKLFNENQDLTLVDYEYYDNLYKKVVNGVDFNPFTEQYTIEVPDMEPLIATTKKEDNNIITYYNALEEPIRIEDGTKITVNFKHNNCYEFEKDENETIKVKKNIGITFTEGVELNKDNSYSYTIGPNTYIFNESGLLEETKNNEYKFVYEEGNRDIYSEYENGKLTKVKRKDGTTQELYQGYMPKSIIEKLPFYNLDRCIQRNFDKVIVEYDANENISSVVLELNSKTLTSKVIIASNGSYQGKTTYKNDSGDITKEERFECNEQQEIKVITNEKNNETITKYNADGKIKQQLVNKKEVMHLEENILYFYDENHKVERYYVYDGDNYIEYDAEGIKLSAYNKKESSTKEYYPNGNIRRIDDRTQTSNYYENGQLESIVCWNNEKKIKIDNKEYILNHGDICSVYESGKLHSIEQTKNEIKTYIEYYESGKLKTKLINGSGKSYYESGKIDGVYEDGRIVASYYETGEIKMKTIDKGYITYYENGNINQQIENNKLTTYTEEGEISSIEEDGLSIHYNNGIAIRYTYLGHFQADEKARIVEINGNKFGLKINDTIELYESGKIKYIQRDNSYTSYYESGALKENRENGNGEAYYETGEVEKIIENNIVVKEFYQSGKLKKETLGNLTKEYYENGNLERISQNGNTLEMWFMNGMISYTNYEGEMRSYYENGQISCETKDGKRYSYYTTGELRSITENDTTTEYSNNQVYAVKNKEKRIVYPCAEDTDFYIEEDLRTDSTGMFDKYKYVYKNQVLYTSNNWDYNSYTYDEEYGITNIFIFSKEDNEKYSIYTNEEYYRSK